MLFHFMPSNHIGPPTNLYAIIVIICVLHLHILSVSQVFALFIDTYFFLILREKNVVSIHAEFSHTCCSSFIPEDPSIQKFFLDISYGTVVPGYKVIIQHANDGFS